MIEIESKWENIELLPSQVIDAVYVDDNYVEIYQEDNTGNITIHPLVGFAATKLFRMTNIHKKDVHKRWEEGGSFPRTDNELLGSIQFRKHTDKLVLRRLKSSGNIMSVVGSHYIPIDMEELEAHAMEALEIGGMNNYKIDRYKTQYARGHDVSRLIVRDMHQATPVVGEIMAIGIQIKNNELGTRGISVCLFMERLACTNGMCFYNTEEAITETHLKDKNSILVNFDEACMRIIDRAWKMLEQIDICSTVDLTPAEMDLILDHMVLDKRISGKVSNAVRETLSNRSYGAENDNLWSFVNAITGVASHQVSHGVKDELEIIASELVNMRSKNRLNLEPIEVRPVEAFIER